MTVAQYVHNRYTKTYAIAFRKNGKTTNFVNGKAYTDEELNAAFPTEGKIISQSKFMKGDNPDKTRIT